MHIKLSNKAYDIIKFIAQIVLPALGTLVFSIASIWGLPYGEQIVGTITAIDVFVGVILGISTKNYNAEIKAKTENVELSDSELVAEYLRDEDADEDGE